MLDMKKLKAQAAKKAEVTKKAAPAQADGKTVAWTFGRDAAAQAVKELTEQVEELLKAANGGKNPVKYGETGFLTRAAKLGLVALLKEEGFQV